MGLTQVGETRTRSPDQPNPHSIVVAISKYHKCHLKDGDSASPDSLTDTWPGRRLSEGTSGPGHMPAIRGTATPVDDWIGQGESTDYDKDLLMRMLRRMMLIRRFDETVKEMVQRGELVGAAHCYIGEEAVAVGACTTLRDDDYITGNHRSHGHPIAKGGDVRRAMAELLGKSTGYCKGKGGSMHLAVFSIGILGESGIVASALPVAVGAALGSRMQRASTGSSSPSSEMAPATRGLATRP